jgi:hypothetical protein
MSKPSNNRSKQQLSSDALIRRFQLLCKPNTNGSTSSEGTPAPPPSADDLTKRFKAMHPSQPTVPADQLEQRMQALLNPAGEHKPVDNERLQRMIGSAAPGTNPATVSSSRTKVPTPAEAADSVDQMLSAMKDFITLKRAGRPPKADTADDPEALMQQLAADDSSVGVMSDQEPDPDDEDSLVTLIAKQAAEEAAVDVAAAHDAAADG